ncbi:unnamed protein product [Phytophthora fragariaefolia]|uniref:Unnamed protein product n=1 Tax=Phytophthora fragariaefolia TaxID=1490495 RepID=A0A9W7D6V9_9STRA|nr:unnamed protein product [Phytophthora fragariaefolia]
MRAKRRSRSLVKRFDRSLAEAEIHDITSLYASGLIVAVAGVISSTGSDCGACLATGHDYEDAGLRADDAGNKITGRTEANGCDFVS